MYSAKSGSQEIASPAQYANTKRALYGAVFFLFVVALILHAGLRGVTADIDARGYAEWYASLQTIPKDEFFPPLDDLSLYMVAPSNSFFEWGFSILAYSCVLAGVSLSGFFLLIASMAVGLKGYAIFRYTPAPFVALMLYVSWYYLLLDMNAIRAGLAAGIVLFGLDTLVRKRYVVFTLLVFVASLFHISALLALIAIPLVAIGITSWRLAFLMIAGGVLGFVDVSGIARGLGIWFPKLVLYADLVEAGTLHTELNVLNAVALARVGVAIMLLVTWTKIRRNGEYFRVSTLLYCLSLALYFGLRSFPPLAARFYEFIGVGQVIAMPYLIYTFRRRWIGVVVLLVLGAVQFYALVYRFQLADFFYFIGTSRVTEVPQ